MRKCIVVALMVGLVFVMVSCKAGGGKKEVELNTRYSVEHQRYLPKDDPYWKEHAEEPAEGSAPKEGSAPEEGSAPK